MSNSEKSVILVVDMINGFINEGPMASKNIATIIKPIKNFIDETKHDTVFISDNHEEDAVEFKNFPMHCVKGSSEAEVVDELKMEDMTVLKKNSVNAFQSEEFKSWFMDSLGNYEEYIVTGCCTDICVLNLALSLKTYFTEKNLPYKVTVKENLVETYDLEGHSKDEYNNHAFKLMKLNGIEVI